VRDRNETAGGSVAVEAIRCEFWAASCTPARLARQRRVCIECHYHTYRQRSDILRRVETILSVLQVVIAVILIFLVLMHSGKDSGLSGAFGVGSGTGPLGGGSLVERNLNRWTIFFAVVFFLNAFLLLKRPWA